MELKFLQSKKFIIGCLLLMLVMGGLYLNINSILSDMKSSIIANLETQFKTEIKVQRLEVSGINQISALNVVLKDEQGNNLLKTEELLINYGFFDLLTNYAQPVKIIQSIELNSPQLNLIKDSDWNYKSLLSSSSPTAGKNKQLFPIYINHGQAVVKTNQFKEEIQEIAGVVDLREGINIHLDGRVEGLSSKIKSEIMIDEQDYQGMLSFSNLKLSNLTNKSNLNLPQNLAVKGSMTGDLKFKGRLSGQDSFYGDLNLKSGNLEYQGLELEQINGQFGINEYGLKLEDVGAYYQNNLLSLKGSIFGWQQPQLNLGYQSSGFNLAALENLVPSQFNLQGEADLSGQIEGAIKEPTIRTKVEMGPVQIAEEEFESLEAELYYKDRVLNLESLDLAYGQGRISLDGTFDFNQSFNYIVNTSFTDLALAGIDLDLLSGLDLTGLASGQVIISGTDWEQDELNILGSLELSKGGIKGYNFPQFSSKFWLNKGKLFLNNTNLEGKTGAGTLNGVIGLDGALDLDLALQNFSLAEMDYFPQLEELKGQVDFSGRLEGSLARPQLKGALQTKSLAYQDLPLGALTAQIRANKEGLKIQEASLADYATHLSGRVDWKSGTSQLIAQTTDLKAAKIDSLIHPQLTLEGMLTAQTKVSSLLSKPQIETELQVVDGQLLNKQNFDSLSLDLSYRQGAERLKLKAGEIAYQDSSLKLSGTMIEEELDFNFNSQEIIWQDINFTEHLKELTGSAEVSGSLYGNLKNPKAAAKLNAQGLEFKNKLVGDLKGRVDYRDHNLYLTDIVVEAKEDQYRLNGSLDLEQRRMRQVNIEVAQGSIDYIDQFLPAELAVSYDFNGRVAVEGALKEPQFDLELMLEDNDGSGNLELSGDYWWAKEADLKLRATKFNLDQLNNFAFLPYQISGGLNLNGELTGKLTAPNFSADLKLMEGQIANLSYEKLAGSLEVIEGKRVILDQELQGGGKNLIQAQGQIPLQPGEDFDLNLALREGNLRVLSLLIPKIESAAGQGNADLNLSGPLESPKVSGEAEIAAGSFAYPLLDRKVSNLNGSLKFVDNKLLLKNITGYYGRGNFAGQGTIILAALQPVEYDLELNGEEIAFEHGSWQGLNDLDVSITGTGLRPEITGQISAYDTEFRLPLDWPAFGDGGGIDMLKPQLDLTVTPGNDVRVVNQKIDIVVQRGSLNLRTIDDKVRLIGELNSNQGRFTYYNTEFELEEGRATFRQYDYMPNLELEAVTEIYDRTIAQDEHNFSDPYHRINLNLTGPADQLNYQLSSDSNISQEKILALLTGQGGIGNLLEKNYQEALTAELRRVIGEGIKTEVIYKVERSFEKSFDLDQVRIKSLLESSDSVEVEIGKYLFSNFMLKYNHSFLEENKQVGFEYYFNHGLDNLMIQGNYNNEGEYELGLEASIPFE